MTILVVGATGSIGRHVVDLAVARGHDVRALVRDARRARRLLPEVELAVGDLTQPDTLGPAVDGVEAIVFSQGRTATAGSGPSRSTMAACATCSPRCAAARPASP